MIEPYEREKPLRLEADSQATLLLFMAREIMSALEIISKQLSEMYIKLGK